MQTAMCAFIAFAVTALSGIWFIPLLKKIKFGQTILEIGPSWHKNKQGTPTMGGLMFITGIVLACCAGFFFLRNEPSNEKIRFASGLIMALGYGFLGFIDDYMKVVRHQNEGLTAKQKFLGQVLLAIVYLLGIYISGTLSTVLKIPFIGQIDLGILYYPVAVFIIVGASNAVNLTDGIDGLCSGVSFVCACGFMVMATILGHSGMTCALAFGIDYPVILVFAGIVYVIETLSDIIQIGSYKLRHKRVFKMAPIHHHFEMCGWSEWKIVIVFSFVMLIGAVISVLAVKAI